jgi:hypothetical protein
MVLIRASEWGMAYYVYSGDIQNKKALRPPIARGMALQRAAARWSWEP